MVPGKRMWWGDKPNGKDGATRARGKRRRATRTAMTVAIVMSVERVMPGPCCSVEPAGMMTTRAAARASRASGQVISASETRDCNSIVDTVSCRSAAGSLDPELRHQALDVTLEGVHG